MNEDLLQCWIYFLTFLESLEMIFSQYTETCEEFTYNPKIGGDDIEYYAKNAIKDLLHANIDVHSTRLISEFPIDRITMVLNT